MEQTKKKKKTSNWVYVLVSVISVVLFLVGWYLATDVYQLRPSYALPSPVKVLTSFIDKFTNTKPDGSTLMEHLGASLGVTLTGYIAASIVGVPLGVFMAWNKKVDLFVRPIFDWFRSVPGLAWIPIMILIFGVNLSAKAAIVFVVSFVPILLNSYAGIKNTNPVHLWVAQTFGADNGQLLNKVAIPSALPLIFTGLRQGLNMAWASIVAAEIIGANRGLGFMIQINRDLARPDLIIVGMLTIGAIGIVLSTGLSALQDRFVRGW